MKLTCTALLILLSILMLLGGCQNSEPVKIGFIGGLSGRNGDLGTAGRDGAQLAVDTINSAGGINGRKVELLVRDDKSDPEQGKLEVATLLKAGVIAIVGPMTSALAEATIPATNNAKVAMVSPTVSSAAFNNKDDYFFHVNLNQDTARATAEYMVKNLNVAYPVVISDISNKAYTGTVAAVFKENFLAAGGLKISEQTFNSKAKPDLLAIARSAIVRETDGIFVIAGALDSAMLCQQIRKLGCSAPIFIAEWGGTNEFLKSGGSAVAGVRIFQHFNADSSNPPYLAFKKEYGNRFREVTPFAAVYSYEAVSIIAEALRKNRDVTQLKQSIISIGSFKGLQGDIAIDAYGDPSRSFSLMQVADGAFTLVK